MQNLKIVSPKRDQRVQRGWEAFFPYYAGYPEVFVESILVSAKLNSGSIVFDPWNGSGTTTSTAARCGYRAIGYDINPVMVVVARARLLQPSEADALEPILKQVSLYSRNSRKVLQADPLTNWFSDETAKEIRLLEKSIRRHLVGGLTMGERNVNLENMSSIAAVFYVALFSVARSLISSFKSTNPTWTRVAKSDGDRVEVSREEILRRFQLQIRAMITELVRCAKGRVREMGVAEIATVDSRQCQTGAGVVDLTITSPPYCTRIDYTAATRVELALLNPLCSINGGELSRSMVGSTRVPERKIEIQQNWGPTCLSFLDAVAHHPSKASSGYYLKTHLDYFDKMSASLSSIRTALKTNGEAILVVQDSYYKEVHNDLPRIISEMAGFRQLLLRRREDFVVRRTMSGLNSGSRNYNRKPGAVESVLCFEAV